jgi:hypothetical protein
VIKGSHAIIHTGREPPEPKPNELPGPDERAMLEPIRVVSIKKTDTMDPMSRVDFSKIYTVEHNVKVYDFGSVHEEERAFLRHQFNWVWRIREDDGDDSEEGGRQDKKKRDRHSKKSTRPEKSTRAEKSSKSEKPTKGEKSIRGQKSTKEEKVAEVDESAQEQVICYVIAAHAYSSSTQDQLELQVYDRIAVTGHTSEDWWNGRNERTGEKGIFPRSYVVGEGS